MNYGNALFVLITTLLLSACGGGGGGGGGGVTTPPPTQLTTATLSFKTISSAHSAPLQGIQMSVKLPTGCTIGDIAQALTGHADIGQLDLGSASYSAANHTASFSIIGTPIKFGTFADLKCAITPDLTASSFTVLNQPTFPSLVMTGVSSSGTSVNLVPEIKVDMAVQLQ